jgi:hypothetical protein
LQALIKWGKQNKKIFYLIFLLGFQYAYSQAHNLDTLFQKLSSEKNVSIRFYLGFSVLTESETNPVDDMGMAEIILLYG